jgi:hypothetical protein
MAKYGSVPHPYLRIELSDGKPLMVPVRQYIAPDGILASAHTGWNFKQKRTFEELIAEIEAFRPSSS